MKFASGPGLWRRNQRVDLSPSHSRFCLQIITRRWAIREYPFRVGRGVGRRTMAHILLVEDDHDVLLVFEDILLEAGHQVDTAETFHVADDLFASREYDMVVSDGLLPDGTGLMLADKAKAKGTPCLIVTGYLGDLRDSAPSVNLANYSILRKPVSANVLQAAVGRMAAR
jgi:DNA-binding NtrC family response regulator